MILTGELRNEFLQKQNFFYNKTVMSDCFVFGLNERIYEQLKKSELHKQRAKDGSVTKLRERIVK